MNYIDCRLCCVLPSLIVIFKESIILFSFSEDKASNKHLFFFFDFQTSCVVLCSCFNCNNLHPASKTEMHS